MSLRRLLRRFGPAALIVVAACSTAPTPEPTPEPSTFPKASPEAATDLATAYLDAWAAGDYAAMYAALDPSIRERYPIERFTELHTAFAELAGIAEMSATIGSPRTAALPPERRPGDFPAPTPTPEPSPDPSASVGASAAPSAEPSAPPDPDALLAGPIPAMAVPFEVAADSERFGALTLDRQLTMVNGRDGWLLRWSPAVVFPELGADGTLRLDRSLGPRGRIVGTDGTVWAETREDGARVYPQEALAGQVIGYVSAVTAEDLATLADAGYQAEDMVGRSGLEFGAEDLLRGTPGWSLVAVPSDAPESVLLQTEMVPGADVAITLRPAIQASAQNVLSPYGEAATAVVDPLTGDVWALASQPAFNPNSMTIGTTLGGQLLTPG